MPPDSDRTALEAAIAEIGLVLESRQINQLLAHLELLSKWNRVYNLTAVRDPIEMMRHHVIDSLAVLPSLLERNSQAQLHRILDVGSGAGFPGLTIATVMPECELVCVDSVGKKASFIRQVIAELGLSNARAEHARIQSLPPLNCDLITCRAFASLADFASLTRPHLAATGIWMAMKGKKPSNEITELPPDIEVFHVEQLHLPGLDSERCLVWMRPKA